MRLAVVLDHEELANLQTSVVVEMWDKRLGGRVKREWLKAFDEKERNKAQYWYSIFYRWYLVKGIPQEHTFKPASLDFVRRLVHFFGTV